MRDESGRNLRSPVVWLLIVLVFLFLLECFLRVWAGGQGLSRWFGLSYPAIQRHEYWRLVTYQFLHDAPMPWHILFNGIGLWFFGRAILEAVGISRFWQVYLGAGLVGGLLEVASQAFHLAWHAQYAGGITVGASANILGLAGAFCFLFPNREIVFFLYVIPIRLRSMTMFWILLGYGLFGMIFPHGDIAHAAHVGGLLAGVAYVKLVVLDEARPWLARFRRPKAIRRPEVPVAAGKVSGRPPRSNPQTEEQETSEEFIRREVDPILDKISAHGLQSLTERERRILELARQRMKKG